MADTGLLVVLFCFTSIVCNAYGHDNNKKEALSYDADNFEEGLRNIRSFVMFYAPWCGHCKNLSPTWNELASIYNNAADSKVIIAKVDCTVHTELCAEQGIVGFPTLKLFDIGGSNHKRYSGKRDLVSLKQFIHDQISGVNTPDSVVKEAKASSDVKTAESQEPKDPVILTAENFVERVRQGFFFIMFYAPWCGHCKKLHPTWDDLANTFNKDNKVTIAKIDCTENKPLCKEQGVTGYPFLLWFHDGKKVDKFQGFRTYDALKKYVLDALSRSTKRGDEKLPLDSGSESKVKELTSDNFESHVSSTVFVFVKFFAPWCGHCKKLAPLWEEIAKKASTSSLSIAKVDCTLYKKICENNQVRGYPTLKLYVKGKYAKDYKGFRTVEDILRFVKKEVERHDEL